MKTHLKLKKAIKLRSEQDNLRIKALNQGVELIAPETIFLSKDTTFGKNVKIEPYVVIGSKVKIGNNVTIKSFSHLEGAKLEKNVTVGPYARIRPGSHFLPGSKVGNFVETKNSKIKSKITKIILFYKWKRLITVPWVDWVDYISVFPGL